MRGTCRKSHCSDMDIVVRNLPLFPKGKRGIVGKSALSGKTAVTVEKKNGIPALGGKNASLKKPFRTGIRMYFIDGKPSESGRKVPLRTENALFPQKRSFFIISFHRRLRGRTFRKGKQTVRLRVPHPLRRGFRKVRLRERRGKTALGAQKPR